MSVLSNRSFQFLALAVALAGAVTVYRSCGGAVIEADREQLKIESSPEVKRQRREAARKGVEGTTEALRGMEDAFGAGSAPQPDAQQQPDKPPEETPQ